MTQSTSNEEGDDEGLCSGREGLAEVRDGAEAEDEGELHQKTVQTRLEIQRDEEPTERSRHLLHRQGHALSLLII